MKKITPKNYSPKKTFPKSQRHGAHFAPSDKRQFAVFKMMYSDKKASHKEFFEKYLPQKNKPDVKTKPVIFGNYGDNESYKKRMTARHYKFIISPDSSDLPMETFVRTYMDRISKELGIKFDWRAAIHTDTEHPHAHILINGKDIKGETLFKPFPKDFVKKRAREIARDISTAMIGERTAEQRKLTREKSLTATRWTVHDDKIALLAQYKPFINEVALTEPLKKRMRHLSKIGLADYKDGMYRLRDKWQDTLKSTGRYNSYLKARDELKWTLPQDMKLWSFKDGTISGVARKSYSMNDEGENDNALVVETKKGAYFVPLFSPPPKNMEGKTISLEPVKNERGRVSPKITVIKYGMVEF